MSVDAIAWPLTRATEATLALANASGFPTRAFPSAARVTPPLDDDSTEPWIDGIAVRIGLETETLRATYGDIPSIVRSSGPALLSLRGATPRLVALVGMRGKRAVVVNTDHQRVEVDPRSIEDALWAPLEEPGRARVEAVLGRTGLAGRRLERARLALLREPVARETLDAGWMLRLPPSASVRAQGSRASLFRTAILMLAATIASDVLGLVAWYLIGRGALGGVIDYGWLVAWALLLFTVIPIRVAASWWQGRIGVTVGALVKQRLLVGALRMDAEEVRGEGTGQIIGRVIESEALESLSLGGGFTALLAGVDLTVAGVVLAAGAGGWLAVLVLVLWTALGCALAVRYARSSGAWSGSRVRMTDDLVERLVGHRTRVAQEPAEAWHDDEDRALAEYIDRSEKLDTTSMLLNGALARGWTIAGGLALVPGLLGHADASAIAVGLGGVILARSAFGKLAAGVASLAGAHVAWQQVGPVFRAGGREEDVGMPTVRSVPVREGSAEPEAIVVASDVSFRYRPQGAPVLKKVALRIDSRDRVLVEGPSGGGKSTLGSVLTGLRSPESGLLLLQGLDRHTLGAREWRRRIVSAPQFHENHVLSNTFAFNLLMGRRWPPRPEDLGDAWQVCTDLGLGPLLEKMPAGMMQMVGETGWQLSHGEKSRLFIARALLQNSRLVVLDESFAALDPETLAVAMKCVLARAPALLVIAHP
jgi:ATP-binding cassette subfamily B protein